MTHNLFNAPAINIEPHIGGYTVSVGLNFNTQGGSITPAATTLFEDGSPKMFDTQNLAKEAMEAWLFWMYSEGYLASLGDFNSRPGICAA